MAYQHEKHTLLRASLATHREPKLTCSRCNRLLRPIAASLAALKKSHSQGPIENDTDLALFGTRQLKRTYSSQRTIQSHEQAHPKRQRITTGPIGGAGNISVSTPLLRRFHNAPPPLPGTSPQQKQPVFRQQPQQKRSCNGGLVESLVKAIRSLLQATAISNDPCNAASSVSAAVSKAIRPKKGPPSLLDTCLHALPQHMTRETQLRRDLDPDDRTDVATEVLEDAEQFDQTGQWLARITRGLLAQMLQDAVVHLDSQTLVPILADLHTYGLAATAESLCERLITMRPPPFHPRTVDDDLFSFANSPALAVTKASGSWAVHHVNRLLRQHVISPTWLATSKIMFVSTRALEAMIEKDGRQQEAADFLQTWLEQSCGVSGPENLESRSLSGKSLDAELSIAVSSLCAFVTALTISGSFGEAAGQQATIDPNPVDRAGATLSVAETLKQTLQHNAGDTRAANKLNAAIVLLARFLVDQVNHKPDGATVTPNPTRKRVYMTLGAVLVGAMADRAAYVKLVDFLTTICVFCEKSPSGGGGLDVLRFFEECSNFSSDGDGDDDGDDDDDGNALSREDDECRDARQLVARLFKDLRLDAAMAFARSCTNTEATDYAQQLERALGNPEAVSTPKRVLLNDRHDKTYRWVEGLGEWITVTPKPQRTPLLCIDGVDVRCNGRLQAIAQDSDRVEKKAPQKDKDGGGWRGNCGIRSVALPESGRGSVHCCGLDEDSEDELSFL